MVKKSGKKDPEEKARRKLAQAELKLHVAQDRHMQARAKGKQEVEQARLRAAKWLAKTAEDVERHSERVARAEARLLSLVDGAVEGAEEPVESSPQREMGDDWSLSEEILFEEPLTPVLGTLVEPSLNGSSALREREMKALQILHADFDADGAAVGEWRTATKMPETTFARARRTLVLRGLVAPDSTVGRNTRYTVTAAGKGTLAQT